MTHALSTIDAPWRVTARAIYDSWMKDERWNRLDMASISANKPLAYFWAEIAANSARKQIADEIALTPGEYDAVNAGIGLISGTPGIDQDALASGHQKILAMMNLGSQPA